MTSNMVKVNTKDGKSVQCYISKPKSASAPVIVIIQEIFGITDWLKSFADGVAAKGFVAVVPDLFFRLEPGLQLNDNKEEDLQKAFKMYGEFNRDQGIDDLKDVVEFARTVDGANGKVGVTGFCLGGLMTYFMACRSVIDCAVAYYGGGIDQKLGEASSIKRPFLLHLAGNDQYIDQTAQKKISEALSKVPDATVHIYPETDHAFCRVGGHHYDQAAAALANKRTDEFFTEHVLKTSESSILDAQRAKV